MITWTVTTRPDRRPETITAAGAEPSLDAAKRASADAVRYALLDAQAHADASPTNTPPTYLVTIDGACAFIVSLGACRPGNYTGVLDNLEHFDGTATHLLYL
jgi:hypothetical protein